MLSEEKEKELCIASGGLLMRKRGRPRKTPEDRSLMAQNVDGTIRKPRQKKSDALWPAVTSGNIIGQQVHGVLDGSFDAGYLLTVRVGESEYVLRGMVFDPSLSVPLSDANDIAPNVKFNQRDDLIAPPPVQNLTLSAGSESSMDKLPMEATPLTHAISHMPPVTSDTPIGGGVQTCMTNTNYYGEVEFDGLEIQNTSQIFTSN